MTKTNNKKNLTWTLYFSQARKTAASTSLEYFVPFLPPLSSLLFCFTNKLMGKISSNILSSYNLSYILVWVNITLFNSSTVFK